MSSERCNVCAGTFVPALGLVPILRCSSCGRELPGSALQPRPRAGEARPTQPRRPGRREA